MEGHYPSNFDLNNIIVVGGMTNDYTPWIGSNYGKKTVDIFAPTNSFTTKNSNELYGDTLDRTSFATPYVTGALALLLSYNEKRGITLSPSKAKEILLSTARKSSTLENCCVSGGSLDLPNLLHTHEYVYTYCNQKQHHRYCESCGVSIYENHNWARAMSYPMISYFNSLDPNARMIYECIGCGVRTYSPIFDGNL